MSPELRILIDAFQPANEALMLHVASLKDMASDSAVEDLFTESKLKATKAAVSLAHKSALECAKALDAVYKQTIYEFTTLQHLISVDAAFHLEASGQQDAAGVVREAMANLAESVSNSRIKTKKFLQEIAQHTQAIANDNSPRLDEWIQGAVEDSVPFSATIKNGLRALFELDLDSAIWEPFSAATRLATWIKVNSALSFEINMIAHFGSVAFELVKVLEQSKAKLIAEVR